MGDLLPLEDPRKVLSELVLQLLADTDKLFYDFQRWKQIPDRVDIRNKHEKGRILPKNEGVRRRAQRSQDSRSGDQTMSQNVLVRRSGPKRQASNIRTSNLPHSTQDLSVDQDCHVAL